MKCVICGSESANEVCNKCIRLEKILYQKEWSFKEGMLIKKTEDFRIGISNLRISGRVAISDNAKGLNARVDNISHYLMNVKECSQVTYQGKKTLMISLEGSANNRYTRFCFLPGFEEAELLVNAIFDAKTKAASLTERIRQNNGINAAPVAVTPTVASPDLNVSIPKQAVPPVMAAPTMTAPAPAAPAPAPVSTDTVALAGIAEDISEFETKIKKLKVLRDNGILSDAEYEAEKKKLVSIF